MSRFGLFIEVECKLCGKKSKVISEILKVCVDCIKTRFNEALPFIKRAHQIARSRYNLPPEPPKSSEGLKCVICANKCKIGEGETGYCGLRKNQGNKLVSEVSANTALMYAYYDPHITNCCASWFCPGGTGAGYPKYAVKPGPEKGYANYAVFFYGCNFDCLFCQNPSHKLISQASKISVEEFVSYILNNEYYTCICYFGGSPEPHLPFVINASKKILKEKPKDRIIRICFEWNGCGNPKLVKEVAEIALVSGGIIKFDVKAWSEPIYKALTGVSNRKLFDNIAFIAEHIKDRPEVPLFMASTLLVPGYVDEYEIRMISRFIARLDPSIPYRLLAFHPDYMLVDLPPTSKKHAMNAVKIAKEEGLENVSIGNIWLLGDYY